MSVFEAVLIAVYVLVGSLEICASLYLNRQRRLLRKEEGRAR